ncbi:MAG: hypothetical protein ACKVVP_02405 [Chloroflexota bacterium]
MTARYVIDTNVLIAASATDPTSRLRLTASPDDPVLREIVREWLERFEQTSARLVMDGDDSILTEYQSNLRYDDYGLLVWQQKWSTSRVDLVELNYDSTGSPLADEHLKAAVADRSDHKFVATAIEATRTIGDTNIVNACDSDWCGCEAALVSAGVVLEQLLRDWCETKWKEKHPT